MKFIIPIKINLDGGPVLSISNVVDVAANIVNSFVLQDNMQKIHNLSSPYRISLYELVMSLSNKLGIEPIIEQAPVGSSNCTSRPFEGSWAHTGHLESFFDA